MSGNAARGHCAPQPPRAISWGPASPQSFLRALLSVLREPGSPLCPPEGPTLLAPGPQTLFDPEVRTLCPTFIPPHATPPPRADSRGELLGGPLCSWVQVPLSPPSGASPGLPARPRTRPLPSGGPAFWVRSLRSLRPGCQEVGPRGHVLIPPRGLPGLMAGAGFSEISDLGSRSPPPPPPSSESSPWSQVDLGFSPLPPGGPARYTRSPVSL